MEYKFEDLSNNELFFEIKKLEAEHESVKIKMVKDYDRLVEIERAFDKVNKILVDRLKVK